MAVFLKKLMTIKIGFIGLGTMGRPMANCLINAGYIVSIFDIDKNALKKFYGTNAIICKNPKETVVDANFCITILPEADHVNEVIFGKNGAVECMNKKCTFIEMSTINSSSSEEIAKKLEFKKINMIDAPVGRTPADALEGKLLIMAGGRKKIVEKSIPVLEKLADEIIHVGPIGSGIKMKFVNNYMSMVGMVMTAETIAFAEKLGIKRDLAVKILQNTAAGRGQINVNFPKKVLSGDITPDFPLRMGLKDISLSLLLGSKIGMPLKLGEVSKEYFSLAKSYGRSEQDCTAMLNLIEDISKIKK